MNNTIIAKEQGKNVVQVETSRWGNAKHDMLQFLRTLHYHLMQNNSSITKHKEQRILKL